MTSLIEKCVNALATFEIPVELRTKPACDNADENQPKDAGIHLLQIHGETWRLCNFDQDTGSKIPADVERLPYIFLSDYFKPREAEYLSSVGENYLDACGNANIRGQAVFIHIDGQRPSKGEQVALKTRVMTLDSPLPLELANLARDPMDPSQHTKTGKAFQTAGLKVLFVLLNNPALIGAPLRTLASIAGVSLGAASNTLNDLAAHGHILTVRGQAQLAVSHELIERWCEQYIIRIRKSPTAVYTTTTDQGWWKEITGDAQLGGEWGAFERQPYLTPVEGPLYVRPEKLTSVRRMARFKQLKSTMMSGPRYEVHTPFWDIESMKSIVAPELVIIADLKATNNPRSHELGSDMAASFIEARKAVNI